MERRPSSSSSTSCAPWRTSPGLARPLKTVFSSVLSLDGVSSLNMEAAVGTPTTSRPWRLVRRVVWSQVSLTLTHYIDKHIFFYLPLIYFSISVDDELHTNTINTISYISIEILDRCLCLLWIVCSHDMIFFIFFGYFEFLIKNVIVTLGIKFYYKVIWFTGG